MRTNFLMEVPETGDDSPDSARRVSGVFNRRTSGFPMCGTSVEAASEELYKAEMWKLVEFRGILSRRIEAAAAPDLYLEGLSPEKCAAVLNSEITENWRGRVRLQVDRVMELRAGMPKARGEDHMRN